MSSELPAVPADPTLFEQFANTEVTFFGITGPLSKLVELCPVPREQMNPEAMDRFTAKILNSADIEIPEQYSHLVEPQGSAPVREKEEAKVVPRAHADKQKLMTSHPVPGEQVLPERAGEQQHSAFHGETLELEGPGSQPLFDQPENHVPIGEEVAAVQREAKIQQENVLISEMETGSASSDESVEEGLKAQAMEETAVNTDFETMLREIIPIPEASDSSRSQFNLDTVTVVPAETTQPSRSAFMSVEFNEPLTNLAEKLHPMAETQPMPTPTKSLPGVTTGHEAATEPLGKGEPESVDAEAAAFAAELGLSQDGAEDESWIADLLAPVPGPEGIDGEGPQEQLAPALEKIKNVLELSEASVQTAETLVLHLPEIAQTGLVEVLQEAETEEVETVGNLVIQLAKTADHLHELHASGEGASEELAEAEQLLEEQYEELLAYLGVENNREKTAAFIELVRSDAYKVSQSKTSERWDKGTHEHKFGLMISQGLSQIVQGWHITIGKLAVKQAVYL